MNIQHKELANGRWASMTLAEQMVNIGSEVSRALNWKNKNKPELSHKAINRALELVDLTIATTDQYPRLKELCRTREALVDFFYGSNEFSSSEILWRKHFDCFLKPFKSQTTAPAS